MSDENTLYITALDEFTVFPDKTGKPEIDINETYCSPKKNQKSVPSTQSRSAQNHVKDKQEAWSYNSIFGEDDDSWMLEVPYVKNGKGTGSSEAKDVDTKREFSVLSLSAPQNVNRETAISNHESPQLDLVYQNETFKDNDSIDFLGSSPKPNGQNHVDNLETQLIVNPSSMTRNYGFVVKETQDVNIEENTQFPPVLNEDRMEESFIEETQITEDQLDSTVFIGPSPPKRVKILDDSQQKNDSDALNKNRTNLVEDAVEDLKLNADLGKVNKNTSEDLMSSGRSEKIRPEEQDDENSTYDALFESQSKRTSSIMGTPESDDELSFLRRSPSPVEVVSPKCPSPVFLVPSQDWCVRARKVPSSKQILTLTQQTQEIRPLSLHSPDAHQFQRQLIACEGKSPVSRPQPEGRNCEDLTQMTQEMEPLSLQLPCTQEFEQQIKVDEQKCDLGKNEDWGCMTQMTQEMEPLSLELPSTQEFQRHVDERTLDPEKNHDWEAMTQMTQEMEPLSLQLPATQDFERHVKAYDRKFDEAGVVMVRETERHLRKSPETQKSLHQSFIPENHRLSPQVQEIKPAPVQFPRKQDLVCRLWALDSNEKLPEVELPSTRTIEENTQDAEKTIRGGGDLEEKIESNRDSLTMPRQETEKNTAPERTVEKPMPASPKEDVKTPKLKKRGRLKKDADCSASDRSGQSEAKFKIPNVAFSNNSSILKPVVKYLGGEVTEIEEASAFVCDRYRMTWKMKIVLDRNIPVVSSNWLTDSKNSGKFLPTLRYILQDTRKCK